MHVEARRLDGAPARQSQACTPPERPDRASLARLNVGTPTFMRAPAKRPARSRWNRPWTSWPALGMDPLELAWNYADVNPKRQPWSSKSEGVLPIGGGEVRLERARRSRARCATAAGWSAGAWRRRPTPLRLPASVGVRLPADGRALVGTAGHGLGTGAYTVFTQTAADALGLPVRVVFELGDSKMPTRPSRAGPTRRRPLPRPS